MPVTLPEPIIKPSPQIITPNPPPITAVIPTVIPPIPEPEKLTEDNVIDYFQNKFESLSNEALEAIKQAIAQKNPIASLLSTVPTDSYQPLINTFNESSKRKHTQLIEANEVGRLNLFTQDNKRKRVDVTI